MSDLIDRQAAIDALEKIDCSDGVGISSLKCDAVDDALKAIEALPPVQPKNTRKRTESHACDLISRQALCEYALNQKDKNITANDIMRFPSAQPRWIPVTERLPNHELAIVQYGDGDFDLLQFPTAYRRKDIVAWLPLPEPYETKSEE